jgi:phosphate starvation-inducible protein PhoH
MSQKDISGVSGMQDAIKRVSHIPTVKVVNFMNGDVVRSGLVSEIVQAYSE